MATAILLAALALLGLASLGSGTAHATFPGENGRIAFAKVNGSGDGIYSDIWVMNADGSDPARLTCGHRMATPATGGERNADPAWSPDGEKIAFVRGAHPDRNIWVMNADGTDQTPLGLGTDPLWSPDGRRIAFIVPPYGRVAFDSTIGVMNADGSDRIDLGGSDDRPHRPGPRTVRGSPSPSATSWWRTPTPATGSTLAGVAARPGLQTVSRSPSPPSASG